MLCFLDVTMKDESEEDNSMDDKEDEDEKVNQSKILILGRFARINPKIQWNLGFARDRKICSKLNKVFFESYIFD